MERTHPGSPRPPHSPPACMQPDHHGAAQQFPPASTRKKLSMSASVPVSPSALKSAEPLHGAAGQVPARQRKNASMSASVPMSPSQLKSALPHVGTRTIAISSM